MGKGKTMAITAVATCGLAAALILAASMTNLFLAGDYYVKIDIEFGASRELHQNAFLKLDLQPIRGVVRWSEISEDSLPPKVAEALD